jgi:hypothetical protein
MYLAVLEIGRCRPRDFRLILDTPLRSDAGLALQTFRPD